MKSEWFKAQLIRKQYIHRISTWSNVLEYIMAKIMIYGHCIHNVLYIPVLEHSCSSIVFNGKESVPEQPKKKNFALKLFRTS